MEAEKRAAAAEEKGRSVGDEMGESVLLTSLRAMSAELIHGEEESSSPPYLAGWQRCLNMEPQPERWNLSDPNPNKRGLKRLADVGSGKKQPQPSACTFQMGVKANRRSSEEPNKMSQLKHTANSLLSLFHSGNTRMDSSDLSIPRILDAMHSISLSLPPPSNSSSSSSAQVGRGFLEMKKVKEEKDQDPMDMDEYGARVTLGCQRCLMYILVLESHMRCPKCGGTQLLTIV